MPTKPQRFRRWWRQTCIVAVVWSILTLASCVLWISGHYQSVTLDWRPHRSSSTYIAWKVRVDSGALTSCTISRLRTSNDTELSIDMHGARNLRRPHVYFSSYDAYTYVVSSPKIHRRDPDWILNVGRVLLAAGRHVDPATTTAGVLVAGPTWLLILLTALPAAWCWRRWWQRRPRNEHACPACGYDLRASRDACPECGRAIESSSAAQS